jgi:hypothetical protein
MHEVVISGEAVAGAAAKALAQVEALIQNVNKQNFDLAELLHTVKVHGYYQSHFSTFKEYTESLSIKARKAQYLTHIVEVMADVGIPRTVYEKLGISKLREITSLDPDAIYKNPVTGQETPMKEFIKDFVANGVDTDLEDIRQHVRTLKGLVGANDIEWRNIPFLRSVLEATIVPALDLARANIGSVGKDDEGISQDASDAACFEVWAIEYLNNPSNNPMNQELHAEIVDSANTDWDAAEEEMEP